MRIGNENDIHNFDEQTCTIYYYVKVLLPPTKIAFHNGLESPIGSDSSTPTTLMGLCKLLTLYS